MRESAIAHPKIVDAISGSVGAGLAEAVLPISRMFRQNLSLLGEQLRF
jgi:hypothetical protein